jgi:transglutaminase-like putative cysteine protease
MKYSKNWLYIDVLIFITFLPFFFVLPFLIKIFVIVGICFVYKKNTPVLWILGFLAIFFTFYNFWQIRDFKIYIQFLVSMLIWGVYLQRTKEINGYIKLAPVIFFGLGLVLFQNVYMLFYVIFEIFLFLVLAFMEFYPLKKAVFVAGRVFVLSLPFVVILFLFFPRVHQKHFFFGFSSKSYESGFSNVLKTTAKKITLTKVPVVEFKLSKNYPNVYLRGEVLNYYTNGIWIKGFSYPDRLLSASDLQTYYLKEYPNLKRYIFALDLPIKSEYGFLNKNYVLKSKKPIKSMLFIKIVSALKYKLSPVNFPYYDLFFDKRYNKHAQKLALKFLKIKDEKKRLQKIIEFFKAQKFVYTLNPKNLDGINIVDSFFREKKGYCVHFASAFTLFCRMASIPARVVVGYLGQNPINGYYKVYSKDAHAWSEVLVNNKWVRVDPTKFAVKSEVKENKSDNLSRYLAYVRYLIEEWILKYNVLKQEKILKFFKAHFVKIIISFFVFVVLVLFFVKNLQKKELLEPLYKKLKKRPHKQSVYEFLSSFNDKRLDEINELYHKIVFYKSTKEDVKKLKRLIKNYKGEK